MKRPLQLFLVMLFSGFGSLVNGQAWHAEIHLEVGDEISVVENVSVTLSGFTVFDNSRSIMDLVIDGSGPLPTGMLSIYVSGLSSDGFGATTELRAQYSLEFSTPCAVRNFYLSTESGHVTGSVVVYPQLEIESHGNCGRVTLSTLACSGKYFWTWEVSEHAIGPFRKVGKNSSSITLTAHDLEKLGLSGYGRKFFRVTSAPGTTSSVEVVDIFYPAPTASFMLTPPKCHGGNDGAIAVTITSAFPGGIEDFIVTVSGNGIERQHVLENTATVTLSGLVAGPYTVRIENNSNVAMNGSCSRDYAVGPLTEPNEITLAATRSNHNGFAITCDGRSDGSLQVKASGGTGIYPRYSWVPNVSTTNTAINLAAGIYTIKVTDSNSCASEPVSYTLSAPEKLAVQVQSLGGKGGFDVSCPDQSDGVISASVSGGVPAYSYFWSNGATANKLTGLPAGTYSVSVSDANGCTAVHSYSLHAPDPIKFDVAPISTIQCAGEHTGALIVQAPQNTIGSIFYHWSSGETSKDITGKAAGTYSVTVSDGQGCHAARSYTLEEPAPWSIGILPTSDYNGMPIRCSGENNGTLAAVVNDDQGNARTAEYYDWYKDGAEILSGPTASSAEGLGAATYRVTVTYNTFCTAEETFVLEEPEPLAARLIRTDPPICQDECNGRLELAVSGGNGDVTCVWSTGDTSPAIDNLCAGTYTAILRDANNCTITASRSLENPTEEFLDLGGSITLCTGQTHVLDPGANWESFSWTGSTGFESHEQRVPVSEAGTYWLEAVANNGCIARDTFTLRTFADLLNANFLVASEALEGDTVVLIDISWPLPDDILWSLPAAMTQLTDPGDILYGSFASPGNYDIGLTATLGECRDEITKSIVILPEKGVTDNAGRLGHEQFVKAFTLYPNPNEGSFDVFLQFTEESPMALTVWNTLNMKKIEYVADDGQVAYTKHIDLRPLSSGTYTLQLDYRGGTKYLRFIVR